VLNRLGMVLLAVGAIWGAKPVQGGGNAPLDVVPSVDLNRYVGK
jgi:hypothetical protein